MPPSPLIDTETFRRPISMRNALAPLSHTLNLGTPVSYRRNAEIFGEKEPADYAYRVINGSVRTYKILDDGRRQIGGFHLPGDIFGLLEFGDEHAFSADAITDTTVLVVKRKMLAMLAGRHPAIARELFTFSGRELRRVQDHVLLLVKTAQERVASFLLEMADRDCSGNVVQLPMSRQDIADYLGLTIETVARTLTVLEGTAVIELSTSRRIVLRDRSALERLNS
jgi:CRP/FNR family transcriptional regulator, nitrogen fixation regulation protein